jgi:hypothetical protein
MLSWVFISLFLLVQGLWASEERLFSSAFALPGVDATYDFVGTYPLASLSFGVRLLIRTSKLLEEELLGWQLHPGWPRTAPRLP